jgi:MFS family permease
MDEKRQRRLLLTLLLGTLMAALDLAIIGPALPAIQADFGIDSRALAWIFNIYVLFQIVGTPLMAKLSDRYGRRTIYVLNLALFGIGSVMVVVAPGFGALLAGRAVQGFGASGIFPVASAVIAFLLGPILGGVLLRFSWHWLFLINIPIILFLIAQALRLVPGTRQPESPPFDAAGAVVLSLLLGGVAVALTNLDGSDVLGSLSTPGVAPFALLAVVLAPVFWWVERRAADPVISPQLFGSLQMRLVSAIAIGAGSLEAGSAFFPALAVSALGVTDYNASLLLLPSVLATTIGAPLMGRALNAVGSRLVVQVGLAGISVGALIYALADLDITLFVIGGIIGGFGFAAILGAPLRFIVLNEATPAQRGAAQGLLTLFLAVGQLGGAALIGAIAASRGGGEAGYQAAFLILGVLTAVLVVLGFGLKSRSVEQAALAAESASRSGAG